LSAELFREVRPDFFRVLSGPNAPVYVDVLDILEAEASQRNEGMARQEALNIIADTLARHPEFQLEPDIAPGESLPESLTVRDKARAVLEYFVRTGWIEAETGSDWRRVVFFDAHGATLLSGLRKMAYPDAAVFTDKLLGVCAALANHAELARQPYEHLQYCRDNTQQGIVELRAMQKSVERLIRRQVEAQTLGDNLSVVFDQYAEQVGHTCYSELVRSHLASRLGEARERLYALLTDADLLQKMQREVMNRHPGLDHSIAMARVRLQIDDLIAALERVLPLADVIDARTAEFTRRSLARFRYLQEVVGERRNQVRALFETLNRQFTGRRFGDLEEARELPSPLLPDARLLAGRDSLYEPARRRTLEENSPLEEEVTEEQRSRTRRQMENALRESLSVARANLYVQHLPGGKGQRLASVELPLHNPQDLGDLVAVLLHAESSEARYLIEVPGAREEAGPVGFDAQPGCRVERFYLVKK
jgi:hypothetical protein